MAELMRQKEDAPSPQKGPTLVSAFDCTKPKRPNWARKRDPGPSEALRWSYGGVGLEFFRLMLGKVADFEFPGFD